MIIWSGWGILSAIFAIIGIVVGMIVGSVTGALAGGIVGGGVAAFLNHLVAKSTGQGKVMIDPATNQQVLLKKSNSLFFIPMSWFTPLLAVGGLLIGTMGMLASQDDKRMDAEYPGKKIFEEADELINSNRKGKTSYGASAEAEKAAETFSSLIASMQKISFEGGSKKNLLTKGEFLTYCRVDEDEIVFLCHVPSMRSYKEDDAKQALGDLAWIAAKTAASDVPDLSEDVRIVVGLRGITSYGIILEGKRNGDPETTDAKTVFYEAFAPLERAE